MYYNTNVACPDAFGQPGRSMKYGVISTAALTRDLTDWSWLYASGECAAHPYNHTQIAPSCHVCSRSCLLTCLADLQGACRSR